MQSLGRQSGPVFANLTPAEAASYIFTVIAKQLPPSARNAEASVVGDRLYVRSDVDLKDFGDEPLLRRTRCDGLREPVHDRRPHDHPGGVVVVITGGHLRFTDQNGKTQEVFAKPGEARWFPPFKHRVENLGDTAYDAVYVGIKGRLATASGPKDGLDEEMARLLSAYLAASTKR